MRMIMRMRVYVYVYLHVYVYVYVCVYIFAVCICICAYVALSKGARVGYLAHAARTAAWTFRVLSARSAQRGVVYV